MNSTTTTFPSGSAYPPELPKFGSSAPHEVRAEHLGQERLFRTLAHFYFLFSAGFFFMVLTVGVAEITKAQPSGSMSAIVICLLLLMFGVSLLTTGIGLVRLKPRAWRSALVLSCAMTLLIPVGTMIGGASLFALLSKKGKFVLSPDYREIVDATPELKPKRSFTMLIFVVLLIALTAGIAKIV